jgi:hypothetical protein
MNKKQQIESTTKLFQTRSITKQNFDRFGGIQDALLTPWITSSTNAPLARFYQIIKEVL